MLMSILGFLFITLCFLL